MRKSEGNKRLSPEEAYDCFVEQKARYEDYFASRQGREIDHKAEQVYAGILKTILDLGEKLPSRADEDAESVREEAERILRNEYGLGAD